MKQYQLWKFTTVGEFVIGTSNSKAYLKRKAKNIDAIRMYICDIINGQKIEID